MTAKLISAFVFAARIVQPLYFLNTKFQASSHLVWSYSLDCVGPGRKPRSPVFSRRGSFINYQVDAILITDPAAHVTAGCGYIVSNTTDVYRFINYQADAIRRTDPAAQVTAGAWSPFSVTDQFGLRNLYKDDCLRKAGGKQNVGKLLNGTTCLLYTQRHKLSTT